MLTTGTTMNSHRFPGFGKSVGRALAAAMVVVVALCFMLQAPVQAQTATALLSNIGQTTAETNQYTDTAQPFGSGANTGGYVLTSIEINTNVEAGQDLSYLPTLKVHSGSATGTEVAALTAPSSTSPTLTYTAPANTTLAASTTYWVVSTGGHFGHWNLADSTTLDSGAATGWTIPGKAQDKVGSTFTDFTGSSVLQDPRERVCPDRRRPGGNGFPIGNPASGGHGGDRQPQVGTAVTATLTDPDGGVTGTTWKWSSASTTDGTYADISRATSASYTPVSGDVGDYLKATASYTDSHGSGKSAEQVSDNAVVDLTAVTVEFGQGTYTVAETDDAETTEVEEHKVEIKVTLSVDPGRQVIIPITKTNEGGATSSDYSGVPASVTFDSGETEQTFTFTATADTVDDDREKVKLSFGTLPAGVTAGTTSETTVSITDDDYPTYHGQLRRGHLLGGRDGDGQLQPGLLSGSAPPRSAASAFP